MFEAIKPELIQLVIDALAILVGVVAFIGIPFVIAAIYKSEFIKRHQRLLYFAGDLLEDTITRVAFTEVDLDKYEEQVDQRETEGKPYIDARMLYVLDNVSKKLEELGMPLNLEILHDRAEAVYQALKQGGEDERLPETD